MNPRQQPQRSTRASQPPAPASHAAAASLPFAFSCLVCLSLLVVSLIILPR